MLPGMNVITAIPISRGIHIEELTYFTAKKNIAAGMVIEAPLRGRTIPAIVLSVEPVALSKAAIKGADFQLKRIGATKGAHLLSPAFMEATKRSAQYHAASHGALLFSTVPAAAFANAAEIAPKEPIAEVERKLAADKTILVAETERRRDHFRNMVRESFARKQSVFIMVPSRIEAQEIYAAIAKGLEEYIFVMTGALSAKELGKRWKAIMDTKHPVAVIATPLFLSIPRPDITTIIVERESSPAYIDRTRPYVDFRILAEHIAEERGIRIVFADITVRAETYWRYETGQLAELARVPKRLAIPCTTTIIDMRAYKALTPRDPFVVISPELKAGIEEELARDGKILLISARRGIAPTTNCLDCGTTKTCPRCDTPLVLHKTAQGNVFLCHTCGEMRSSEERCFACDSWRLQYFGIGTQRVYDEIEKMFPGVEVSILDSDNAKTHKEATEIAKRFAEKPRQIVVGTERAASYIPTTGLSGIVSLDSLLSIPEWNVYERVFGMILRLREKTEHNLIIQTRKPETSVLKDAVIGNLLSFYERELGDRKRFGYPPFKTLIRIDAVAGRDRHEHLIVDAERRLGGLEFARSPRAVALAGGLFRSSGLLRVPKPAWPHPELLAELRSLPPSLAIRIDPESVV